MDGNVYASKRLAKGTIIYMLGNLMSKVLQMLILPIITTSLLASEYGYYDIIITTISLITPVFTLQFIEGLFRYLFHASEKEKEKTVSTVTAFLLFGLVVLACIIVMLHYMIPNLKYLLYIYINYFSAIVFNYMQKLSRCEQMNAQFALSGVINTFTMLICQVVALLVLHLGVQGMLLANCISYLVASIYLEYYVRVEKRISIKNIDKSRFIELFKYSIPLVPNSICWWLISSSDRYIITFFLGATANGIYSIASKFSQLLTFATSVFQLAWQESAIIEKNNKYRDDFYSTTFNTYMRLLLGGYLVILPIIRLVMPLLVSDGFQEGYLYNPLLLLGAIFSAFSQFYGSAYLVFKKTNGAFTTTVIAAGINVIIATLSIKYIGLYGPALGTAMSFFIQWLIRMFQMKKYFKVKIENKNLFILLFFMSISTICYYSTNIFLHIVTLIFGMCICIIMNKKILKNILKKITTTKGENQ
ncbi:lipopolysaccharide biosynthesis protein [Eubacterium limosum]|uniref:Polysaccharide biosynthesis protein n=1 Tax=Eubacterium limosum TaxID=1736 RepID=A0AAC9QWH9_EUBLI|nr:oligosaccharide flippase family protein [Eubacterium limosum]ARD67082.1 hypothetical protein B2M23_16750 [Eubacterium limosum]UQZ23068.1 oligosaccharide flippase family protein [Eubacterium limosum]